AGGPRELDAAVSVSRGDVGGEAGAHVKGGVGFARIDGAGALDEAEDWRRVAEGGEAVDEGLVEAHELAPAVTGDVGGIVQGQGGGLAVGDEADVDHRWVEQRFAIGAAVVDGRKVALWEAVGQ